MNILETIQQKLDEIEQKEHVRILHAVESGSRAWGFASPDSDYDVRFIYVRPEEDYLRLGQQRDVIEWQLDDTLDINGWDLQKALRLMHGSNPTLFEWCDSPVVYRTTDLWQHISQQGRVYFSERAGYQHYLSMAKHTYQAYLTGENVRLKKYFYCLRPVLACRWIQSRHCVPPVAFDTLAESMLPDTLRDTVSALVAQKMQTSELGAKPRIPLLHDYLERSLTELTQEAAALPPAPANDWALLDRLFLEAVRSGA
ncbi:MAG: nucleotidyltransferase domain-containing protein [Oscillospiraceae bacterium]|nr:nucleotidyltransferase domain-containing protein [Oscillospiraceae bacterium]